MTGKSRCTLIRYGSRTVESVQRAAYNSELNTFPSGESSNVLYRIPFSPALLWSEDGLRAGGAGGDYRHLRRVLGFAHSLSQRTLWRRAHRPQSGLL